MIFRWKDVTYTVVGFGILLSILVIWQVASVTDVIPSVTFPPASDILIVLYHEIANGQIPVAMLSTLVRMTEAFAIASVLGIFIGIAIGSSLKVARSFDPLMQFLRPLPAVAIIPLIALYLGLGSQDVIIPATFGCIWPVVLNTIDGFRSIDPTYIDTAEEFKIKGLKKTTKIVIPAVAPFILSGMRVSLAMAWVISIAAEFITAVVKNGVGVLVFFQFNAGDFTGMYASIFAVAIVAYILNRIYLVVQSHLIPWHGRWQIVQ